MKAIVLAAGRGERLMPLTADRPKSLVDLGGGRTVFDEQVDAMRASGCVSRIVFVVGYRAEMIEARTSARRRGRVEVDTLFNPFYTVSNNLASLFLARSEMDQDFLVTNGDNLFTVDVYTGLVTSSRPGITLAVCPKNHFDSDDMKVVRADGALVAIGKTLDPERAEVESPGLVAVRGAIARRAFRDALDRALRRQEALGQFWLEVFNVLVRGGTRVDCWTFESAGRWQEIDFHTDMSRAGELVRAKAEALRPPAVRQSA